MKLKSSTAVFAALVCVLCSCSNARHSTSEQSVSQVTIKDSSRNKAPEVTIRVNAVSQSSSSSVDKEKPANPEKLPAKSTSSDDVKSFR